MFHIIQLCSLSCADPFPLLGLRLGLEVRVAGLRLGLEVRVRG
jgi:hypothetical protein